MDRTRASLSVVVLLVLGLVLSSGGRGCTVPGLPGERLVVMLHEAKHGPFAPYVMGAANELTAAGFEVRAVDDDTTDGGETPEWLKPALEQGRAIMGGMSDDQQKDDALIVLSGGQVAKATKMPATTEEIVRAVK